MTTFHGKHGIGRTHNPPRYADGTLFGGVIRNYREVIPLEGQKAGDDFHLFDVPRGLAFKRGQVVADRVMPSVTFSIGTKDRRAKFRRVAAHDGAINAPIDFGQAQAGAFNRAETIETVLLHVEGGVMPKQGTLVIDMEFCGG